MTEEELEDDRNGDDQESVVDPRDSRETAAVLAKRLEQLRDTAWLGAVLETALAEMAAVPLSVTGHEIDYCKIKPNRDINVAVRARLSDPDGTESPFRFSCTLYGSAAACRMKFSEDEHDEVHESARRRLQQVGLSRPVVVLDEPAMVVRAFPADPELPGLAPATDVEEMLPLLASRLDLCRRTGREPVGLRYEIMHYKPRRSCAIHYTVDFGGAMPPARVYGKLARDDRGVHHHRLLSAAWEAASASDGLWHAARPVGYVRDWKLLLQEAVQGRDFRLVFAELTPDAASSDQLAEVRALLDKIARAVHALQRAPVVPGSVMTFDRLHAAQEKNLHYMKGMQPDLADELAAIRREAARLERETAAGDLVFAHGDFAHGNVLIDGDRVGIIDFDKAGAAEPSYDVAYFLTHMWSFGIRHRRRMPHVARLCQHFRTAYLALEPAVSSERLALYEALDFAAYVLRNFRKQSHQDRWLAWARGQVAAAWDRLAVAAGGEGTLPS